jgi:predicted MFS family arabinose efflux permease
VGRLSDRFGHLKVFTMVSLVALAPMLAVTVLPPLPLPAVLIATTAFMIFSSGRMVPGMAMVTGCVAPRMRGGFMNLNSAFQQVASGLAAMIGGAIIVQGPGGTLERYVLVGLMGSACVLVSLLLARNLRPAPVAPASEPAPASAAKAGGSPRTRSGSS